MAEQEGMGAPEEGSEAAAGAPVEPAEGRAARRAPHPAWRIGQGLLILSLMAGAAWAGYGALVYIAGPVLPGPTQVYDPQGSANLYYIGVHPLPPTEGEGVLITWTTQNVGSKSWSPGTHYWQPLYPDLPPLPLPRTVISGATAEMAVRLEGQPGPVVGWRLMGLKGPVEDGQIEVTISTAAERK